MTDDDVPEWKLARWDSEWAADKALDAAYELRELVATFNPRSLNIEQMRELSEAANRALYAMLEHERARARYERLWFAAFPDLALKHRMREARITGVIDIETSRPQ